MLKIKKKKFSLINIIICTLITGIISTSMFISFRNILKLEYNNKVSNSLENVLTSEINYYHSLKKNLISENNYLVNYNNLDINVNLSIIESNDEYIKYNIEVSFKDEKKNQTIERI